MFNELVKLSHHTLVYGMGYVLKRMVVFLLLPFLTRALSPAEYGIYSLYFLTIAIVLEIVRMGQDIALLRFYVLEKDVQRRRGIFSVLFWLALGVSTAAGAILWWKAEFWVRLILQMPEYPDWTTYVLKLCALVIWLDNLSAYPMIVLRGEGRALWFTIINLCSSAVQFGMTVWFLIGLNRGIRGIFEANVIASALALAFCLPVIISRLRPVFDTVILKSCLAFGLPNLPNLLFVTMVEQADRKVMELLRGAAETGLYSAGYRLGMFLSIVATGFRFAWQPFFLQAADRPDAKAIFGRVLTYYLAVTAWIYLLLTAFMDPLVRYSFPLIGHLVDPAFWPGLRIFPVILLAQVFAGVHAVFMVGVYLEKKTAVLPLITGIAAAVNIGFNWLLVPRWGMWAAAWMTVLAYALMVALLYVYIQRYYYILYEWGRVGIIAAVTGGIYALVQVFKSTQQPGWGYGLVLAFPLILALIISNSNERRRLRRIFHLKV